MAGEVIRKICKFCLECHELNSWHNCKDFGNRPQRIMFKPSYEATQADIREGLKRRKKLMKSEKRK